MKSKIRVIVFGVVSLCIFQIAAYSQTSSADDEIKELTQRLIAAKEKRIKELEESAKKERQELEKLKSESTSNPVEVKPVSMVKQPENNTPRSEDQQPARNEVRQPTTNNNPTSANNPASSSPQTSTSPQTTSDSDDEDKVGRCAKERADPNNTSLLDRNICGIAKIAANRADNKLFLNESLTPVTVLLATKLESVINPKTGSVKLISNEENSLFFDSEKKRTDKQIGSSPNSSGTTSLVVKGGTAAILGWAVENGSINPFIDGNTVTLRLNPYNLSQALFAGQSILDIKRAEGGENPYFDSFLRKLSLGFSFDTSRGRETPELRISKQQLSSWSVRYEFINRRNPLSKHWRTERHNLFKSLRGEEDIIVNAIDQLEAQPVFEKAAEKLITEINAETKKISGTFDKETRIELIGEIVVRKLEEFSVAELSTDAGIIDIFRRFVSASETYLQKRKDFLDRVNRAPIATFEYTNNREVNAPDTSNFRFIYEHGIGNLDVTFNAEMTVFNKKPAEADVKRIKDFNFALQLDAPLNTKTLLNKSVFSFAFRYTRQQSDVVLPNGVVADGTKGDILFGQAKLTIPFGNTGIKLPLSLTFGNRSEFVKESFTRANFGITFDLDQVFRPINLFK